MSSLAPSITHFCNFGNSDSMFESFDSGLQLSKNRISDHLWGPVAQLGARFHGMEEVVGSIPTRSTKSLNKLGGTSAAEGGVCDVKRVVTHNFGA